DIQNDIDNADPDAVNLNDVVVRYTLYGQDNEQTHYSNSSIKNFTNTAVNPNIETPTTYGYNNGNLTSRLGRFGEYNLYDLWVNPSDLINGSTFVGLKQRSISKGKARTGNLGIGSFGASGTKSDAVSKVLNQYIDLNGDRYPDIVTDGTIQFTDMQGALFDSMNNNFVSGSQSHDETQGVNISGMFPNSTASDNNKSTNSTRTNINSGFSTSDEDDCYSYNSKQWNDINGDGLTDRITFTSNEILVELNTGYGFGSPVSWGNVDNIKASNRSSDSVNLGGGVNFGNSSYAIGLGGGESEANINTALIDVNSDGLPDLVKRNGNNYAFYLNKGTSFEPTSQQTFYNNLIDQDYSLTGNVFGSYTYGFPIQIW